MDVSPHLYSYVGKRPSASGALWDPLDPCEHITPDVT
jgi:hypothetical protein